MENVVQILDAMARNYHKQKCFYVEFIPDQKLSKQNKQYKIHIGDQ